MAGKRKAPSRKGSFKRRRVTRNSRTSRKARPSALRRVAAGVQRLTRMIETKDMSWKSGANVGMAHNNVHIVTAPGSGGRMNPIQVNVGNADGMGNGQGTRIGDEIMLRGVLIKGMVENALQRPKVYYRLMVVRSAKGDVPTRATLFQGNADNKMLDQINTERYTVIREKTFNCTATNYTASTVTATGVPYSTLNIAGDHPSGIATKLFSMWIPGSKLAKGGRVRYENGSTTQMKFYDYTILFVCYDWFGTPQDVNDVGKINEMYSKVYYKDA